MFCKKLRRNSIQVTAGQQVQSFSSLTHSQVAARYTKQVA